VEEGLEGRAGPIRISTTDLKKEKGMQGKGKVMYWSINKAPKQLNAAVHVQRPNQWEQATTRGKKEKRNWGSWFWWWLVCCGCGLFMEGQRREGPRHVTRLNDYRSEAVSQNHLKAISNWVGRNGNWSSKKKKEKKKKNNPRTWTSETNREYKQPRHHVTTSEYLIQGKSRKNSQHGS